jgi:hypothetical protein
MINGVETPVPRPYYPPDKSRPVHSRPGS